MKCIDNDFDRVSIIFHVSNSMINLAEFIGITQLFLIYEKHGNSAFKCNETRETFNIQNQFI